MEETQLEETTEAAPAGLYLPRRRERKSRCTQTPGLYDQRFLNES